MRTMADPELWMAVDHKVFLVGEFTRFRQYPMEPEFLERRYQSDKTHRRVFRVRK